jgi:hypothetical protein
MLAPLLYTSRPAWEAPASFNPSPDTHRHLQAGDDGEHAPGWIVFGWYTPDYAHWFAGLEKSLIAHGAPYDFWSVPKLAGGWERNTRRKAEFALAALALHPGKTVILLDVDCIVTGALGVLASLNCDIGVNFHIWRKRGKTVIVPATGHMVLNPTRDTRDLIAAWVEACKDPGYGVDDQDALAIALEHADGIRVAHLGKDAGGLIKHARGRPLHLRINGRGRIRHWAACALHAALSFPAHR